jgi:hypothetical protein
VEKDTASVNKGRYADHKFELTGSGGELVAENRRMKDAFLSTLGLPSLVLELGRAGMWWKMHELLNSSELPCCSTCVGTYVLVAMTIDDTTLSIVVGDLFQVQLLVTEKPMAGISQP